jgi:hypothetical protein
MGELVMLSYRPKPGKETALLGELRSHVSTLQQFGLATERPQLLMKVRSGVIVEMFEWEGQDAIGRAHQYPPVLELWDRIRPLCDYATLADIPEARNIFVHLNELKTA